MAFSALVTEPVQWPQNMRTINEAGSFEYEVTALAADSTLSRILHAVESAQGGRAPIQRFVDRFAEVYTPLVFGHSWESL